MANHIRNDKLAYNLTFAAICAIKPPVLRSAGSTFKHGRKVIMTKKCSDCQCAGGRGNVAVGNQGPLDDLIAAEAVEKQKEEAERIFNNNQKAERQGVVIRRGLPVGK